MTTGPTNLPGDPGWGSSSWNGPAHTFKSCRCYVPWYTGQPSASEFNLGDFVRLVIPEDRKAEAFARGRVTALERFEDMNGVRSWVHVRWFDSDGCPNDQTKSHAANELEKVQ